jgi:hypothetical protein
MIGWISDLPTDRRLRASSPPFRDKIRTPESCRSALTGLLPLQPVFFAYAPNPIKLTHSLRNARETAKIYLIKTTNAFI